MSPTLALMLTLAATAPKTRALEPPTCDEQRAIELANGTAMVAFSAPLALVALGALIGGIYLIAQSSNAATLSDEAAESAGATGALFLAAGVAQGAGSGALLYFGRDKLKASALATCPK